MNLTLQMAQQILTSMHDDFDAMNFIRAYQEIYPNGYAADMATYREQANPVKILHQQIGRFLENNKDALNIVQEPNKKKVINTIGFETEVALWHKL